MRKRLAQSLLAFVALALIALASPWVAAAEPMPQDKKAEVDPRPITQRLNDVIDPIKIENAPAKAAFEWWSKTSGIPLLINWSQMERDGVDAQTPITLDMRFVPSAKLLGILMQQAAEQPLIYTVTPWYLQVTTKTDANRHLVTQVYDIGDLMHDAEPVSSPPRFDIGSALNRTNASGSGSNSGNGASGGGGLFQTDNNATSNRARPESERSEDVAKTIRDTIEPEIWKENGGPATIKYYRGRLIVNAPQYVQAQIGIPEPVRAPLAVNPRFDASKVARDAHNGVSAVASYKPSPVAGKERE